jgi:ElaB/YqjD/DUF883 family membrane-anchored ribosome-binding protein
MKSAILEKTTEYLGDSADAAKKAASVVIDATKVMRGAAVRGYDAAGDAVHATGRQIRRKPVAAVLGAVAAGFFVGLLIGRKRRR